MGFLGYLGSGLAEMGTSIGNDVSGWFGESTTGMPGASAGFGYNSSALGSNLPSLTDTAKGGVTQSLPIIGTTGTNTGLTDGYFNNALGNSTLGGINPSVGNAGASLTNGYFGNAAATALTPSAPSFTGGLASLGKGLKSGLDGASKYSGLLGSGAKIYGAYSTAQAQKRAGKLMRDSYNRSIVREKKSNDALSNGFANSTYSKGA